MTAQEQAIRTEYISRTIDKEDINSKCRMCGEWDETVAEENVEEKVSGESLLRYGQNVVTERI